VQSAKAYGGIHASATKKHTLRLTTQSRTLARQEVHAIARVPAGTHAQDAVSRICEVILAASRMDHFPGDTARVRLRPDRHRGQFAGAGVPAMWGSFGTRSLRRRDGHTDLLRASEAAAGTWLIGVVQLPAWRDRFVLITFGTVPPNKSA